MAFIATVLLASCSEDTDYSADFGQIKVPDTRQLEQTVSADDTQGTGGVTFTTEAAWSSAITATRAGAPDWISISPDHGDAAGVYTLKIMLRPNDTEAARTAKIVITCGTSKIEIIVTQEATTKNPDEPDLPATDRLRKIVWRETSTDREQLTGTFEYDAAGRLTKYVENELWESNDQQEWFTSTTEMVYNADGTGTHYFWSPKTTRRPNRITLNEAGDWSLYDGSYTEQTYSVSERRTYTYKDGYLLKEEGYSQATPDDGKGDRWMYEWTWTDGNLTAWKFTSMNEAPTPASIDSPDNTWDSASMVFEYGNEDNPLADEAVDPVLLNNRIDYMDDLALGFLGKHSRKLVRKITGESREVILSYTFDDKGRISRIDQKYTNGEGSEPQSYYALLTYGE